MDRKELIEFLKMCRELLNYANTTADATGYNPNKFNFSYFNIKLHEIVKQLSPEEIKEIYPAGLRG